MPTADEIAAAVWRHAIRNGFGDTVQAQQILVAGEKRTADIQQTLAALTEHVARLQSAFSLPQRGRTLITAGQSVRIRGVHGLARRRRATRSRRTIT